MNRTENNKVIIPVKINFAINVHKFGFIG